MTRRFRTIALGLPLAAMALGAADDPPAAPRRPSLMALMQRQYNVSRAPFKVLKAEAEAETPDWPKAVEAAGKFAELAGEVASRTPRLGAAESWRALAGGHVADAKAMADAANSRDASALRAAHARVAASCTACHKAHRQRRGD